MEAILYNQKGGKAGSVTLPEKVFGLPWNSDLVHQVVTSMRSSARAGTAHTKDRSAVRGGGKKPWQQKGTGRARHGSIRSPIWRGGGVTHGPKSDKNYERAVTKSMKSKALRTLLSRKLKDSEVLFLDTFSFAELKSKNAKVALDTLSTIKGFERIAKKRNAVLIALPERNQTVQRSFRNFGNVLVTEARNLNPVDLLTYQYLLMVAPEKSVETLVKHS